MFFVIDENNPDEEVVIAFRTKKERAEYASKNEGCRIVKYQDAKRAAPTRNVYLLSSLKPHEYPIYSIQNLDGTIHVKIGVKGWLHV